MAAFSVSTTATISPRFTPSPGRTRHSARVPASISAPSEGMRNSATFSYHALNGCDDAGHLRDRRILKVLGVRHGHLDAADSRHGSVKLVEGVLHDARHDLGREDRKSTRLNSSHSQISYAVFCLKKK